MVEKSQLSLPLHIFSFNFAPKSPKMANHLQRFPTLHSDSFTAFFRPFSDINPNTPLTKISVSSAIHNSLNFRIRRRRRGLNGCSARRRVRFDDEDEDYGHNHQIALLETYTQAAAGEALIVHADVDGEVVEVLIFKGFSSCLSYGTSPDPSRSVLPARAVIKSIDIIKGPFDPSNIQYLQKNINWESFKFPK